MTPDLLDHGFAGMCIAVRILAVALTAPVIGQQVIPWKIRSMLAVGLAATLAPALVQNELLVRHEVSVTADIAILLGALVCEAALGAAMGMSLSVLMSAIQLTGRMMESMSGLSMAAMMDPQSQVEGGPLARLYWWTTLAVFVASGGIHQVMAGMLSSFQHLPPGQAVLDRSLLDYFVTAIASSFEIAMRAAIPGLLALLAASWVLGMAQRSLPQLGSMQVGLGIKSVTGILVTSLLLVTAPWVVGYGIESTLDQFQSLLHTLTPLEQTNV